MSLRCLVVNLTLVTQQPKIKGYPKKLTTLGDHLRKVRLDRNLSQPDVAKLLSVDTETVTCWELNRNAPTAKYAKKIISFLGYVPFDMADMSLGQKLYHTRLIKGVSQRQLSKMIGCDTSNLRLIELDQRIPRAITLRKIETFLEG